MGALLGKSLPAAIHLLISAARRKMSTKEIVTGLKDGGVESTSRNFDNTVNTALHRLRTAGTVLKFNDGWALSEFYPENIRRNIVAQAEGKKSAPKAKRRTRKRVGTDGVTMSGKILEMLNGFGDDGATIQDIVDALRTYNITVNRKYVRGILSREYALGNLSAKRERGRYFAKAQNLALVRTEERAS